MSLLLNSLQSVQALLLQLFTSGHCHAWCLAGFDFCDNRLCMVTTMAWFVCKVPVPVRDAVSANQQQLVLGRGCLFVPSNAES